MRSKAVKIGMQLSANLTVMGIIDGGAKEPVYLVWNHDAWCPMACKVFQTLARAREEAAMLECVSHPYIVPVLGVEAPGCLLMPFMEGRTLADLVDASPHGRLPLSDGLRVAIHIGAALQYVHTRDVLHMDVKPGNVFLLRSGRAVLFDFGSARKVDEKRPSSIVGTNAYIAPEECLRGRATPASDVFSFGVTVFEMLSGKLPFGRTTKQRPFPQLDGALRPLMLGSRRAPKQLESVMAATLDRNPQKRPPLSSILPIFNSLIVSGATMWPEDFEPACRVSASRKRIAPRAGEAPPL